MVYENIIVWVSDDYNPKKEKPNEYAERVTPTLKGWNRFSRQTQERLYNLVVEVATRVRERRKRIIGLETPPGVKEWYMVGLDRLIREHEWLIVYYRHELRKLGAKLVEPYPYWRIRRLEEWYLKKTGWTRYG
jgi:hypothetical protein